MHKNPFITKGHELLVVLQKVLAAGLPPLFLLYHELLNCTDPLSHEGTCSLEKLADQLKCNQAQVKLYLQDLSILKFIKYKEEKNNVKVKLLVH